jgi:hypothetical protein
MLILWYWWYFGPGGPDSYFGECFFVIMGSLMNFGWFIWTICYCWLFGPEKLDDYMGLYFASMMKYLLGYYWVIFGLVLCLAFNQQYLIRSAGSHICVGPKCFMLFLCASIILIFVWAGPTTVIVPHLYWFINGYTHQKQ